MPPPFIFAATPSSSLDEAAAPIICMIAGFHERRRKERPTQYSAIETLAAGYRNTIIYTDLFPAHSNTG